MKRVTNGCIGIFGLIMIGYALYSLVAGEMYIPRKNAPGGGMVTGWLWIFCVSFLICIGSHCTAYFFHNGYTYTNRTVYKISNYLRLAIAFHGFIVICSVFYITYKRSGSLLLTLSLPILFAIIFALCHVIGRLHTRFTQRYPDFFLYYSTTTKSRKELDDEYGGWKKFSVAVYAVSVAVTGFLIYRGLGQIHWLNFREMDPDALLYTTPPLAYALPALCLGLFAGLLPSHYLMIWLLGRQHYDELVEYSNQLEGDIDSWKVARFMGWIMIPTCLGIICLLQSYYLIVTPREFITKPICRLAESTYKLKEVEYVRRFKRIDPTRKTFKYSYEIGLRNGTKLDLEMALLFNHISTEARVASYISQHSGIEISDYSHKSDQP